MPKKIEGGHAEPQGPRIEFNPEETAGADQAKGGHPHSADQFRTVQGRGLITERLVFGSEEMGSLSKAMNKFD